MQQHQLQTYEDKLIAAVQEHNDQLYQIRKQIKDYDALVAKLQSLPLKTTHSCMVPLGDMAFMPGILQHTNEIMVLLGENYFVERSAAQAVEIAQRRIASML